MQCTIGNFEPPEDIRRFVLLFQMIRTDLEMDLLPKVINNQTKRWYISTLNSLTLSCYLLQLRYGSREMEERASVAS